MLRRLGEPGPRCGTCSAGELLQFVLAAVPVPGGEVPHLAVVVEQGDEAPSRPAAARTARPAGRAARTCPGSRSACWCASAISASRLWAPLGVGLRALGVGARLLGDRAGQLGLLARGLLRGEGGLPLVLDPHALGDVGLHADEADQRARRRRRPG